MGNIIVALKQCALEDKTEIWYVCCKCTPATLSLNTVFRLYQLVSECDCRTLI